MARELVRVAKPGGAIAFTTWPPDSVVGPMLTAVAAIVPPPGAMSPLQWGVPETVTERLGDKVEDLRFETGTVSWPTLSPGHMWNLMSTSYGPFITALGKLEPAKQQELAQNVKSVFESHMDGNALTFQYLLTRATKA